MSKIQEKLDILWGTTVKEFNIDHKNHRIDLKTVAIDNGVETNYEVVFEDVISYCWVNDSGNGRLSTEEWNYVDLTAVHHIAEASITLKGNYIDQYVGLPNILLEMWNSILLIEAKRLKVNNDNIQLAK
ncbi:hypothetical protein MJA45_04035 [Paenibacillus aurantius]|uniref:Uncharacterized protein n=1 Tax=Paenibacillus aurantius TaxID=2918900 RepID=A0AA96LFH1_9BACL|nr:hypothetical protein [Paenibacillus aurantius]WNQ12229.1 hypothetical protein MJA45_04035 [Paenibacillus aurantius]